MASLTTVRDLLGHLSAATTSRYLTWLGASEAVAFAHSNIERFVSYCGLPTGGGLVSLTVLAQTRKVGLSPTYGGAK